MLDFEEDPNAPLYTDAEVLNFEEELEVKASTTGGPAHTAATSKRGRREPENAESAQRKMPRSAQLYS